MIAGSIMELSNGFSLFQSASLSIRRFNGGLPVMLLQSGIFDRRTWYLLTIAILLSSTTISSYFLSTGLVSDLGIAPIIGQATFAMIPFASAKTDRLLEFDPDYSAYMPPIYPAFGEYSEPPITSPGIDDTGRIMRALLPIPSPTTREALSNFTGLGTLLNSHVICMKPKLENFTLVTGGGQSGVDSPYIRGMVSVGSSMPPGLAFFNSTQSSGTFSPTNFLSFTCGLSIVKISSEWPVSMCVAGNYFGNENITGGGTDGTYRVPTYGLAATSFLDPSILSDPLSYILVNYSGSLPPSHGLKLYTNWTDVSDSDSSWRTMKNLNTYPSNLESISLSYCFTNFTPKDSRITVTSSTNRTEPVLRALNSSAALDASNVLSQLNANGANLTLAERGVLALSYSDRWPFVPAFPNISFGENYTVATAALAGTYGLGMAFRKTFTTPSLQTWALCTYCATDDSGTATTGISASFSSMFQSSFQRSGSAATALNAVITSMNMVQYYTRLQQAEVVGPSYTTLIEQQLQPVRNAGLITVTAATAIHLMIVAAVSLIFLCRTKYSFIGESWHTIAQLQSRDVIPVLQASNLMRDEEVEAWLEDRDVKDEEMSLKGSSFSNDAHIVRRRIPAAPNMI